MCEVLVLIMVMVIVVIMKMVVLTDMSPRACAGSNGVITTVALMGYNALLVLGLHTSFGPTLVRHIVRRTRTHTAHAVPGHARVPQDAHTQIRICTRAHACILRRDNR